MQDRRTRKTQIHPDRRIEDLKKAAAEALERFNRETEDLKQVCQKAYENGYRRQA